MQRSRIYTQCLVPRCSARGGERWIAEHAQQKHVGCSCGYVGVSFKGHMSHVRRRGGNESLHQEQDPS